ncbi:MAG: hypothetical protein DI536_18135 [Archangium gephyra]|uniref:Lipocalin-like domain-containing protein n=1 Tax=Archangium gephyra TaxID=48 RepID=A0A2W5T6B9_9BACT|nr:MAG: hypothetical protein DI536_18135 [Archangium gephyra]
MKRALLLTLVLLGACGRDELRDDDLTRREQQSLSGTYEFGPMVGKGLPPADESISYPESRLAKLKLGADGTFEMDFMMGCVGNYASGTWSMTNGTAHLELSPFSVWTDWSGTDLKVTALDATPTAGGLTITGQSNRGAISQKWEAAR